MSNPNKHFNSQLSDQLAPVKTAQLSSIEESRLRARRQQQAEAAVATEAFKRLKPHTFQYRVALEVIAQFVKVVPPTGVKRMRAAFDAAKEELGGYSSPTEVKFARQGQDAAFKALNEAHAALNKSRDLVSV